jgi:hypothetical protein
MWDGYLAVGVAYHIQLQIHCQAYGVGYAVEDEAAVGMFEALKPGMLIHAAREAEQHPGAIDRRLSGSVGLRNALGHDYDGVRSLGCYLHD